MKTSLFTIILTLGCLSFNTVASAGNPFTPFREKTCADWQLSPNVSVLSSELRSLAESKCLGKGLYARAQSELIITSRKTKVVGNYYGPSVLYKTCGERYFVCR